MIVRTSKGKQIFEEIKENFEIKKVSYGEMTKKNPSMTESTPGNEKRKAFFEEFDVLPIEENISGKTDLYSFRKKVIRFTEQTGIFKWIKKVKTALYH